MTSDLERLLARVQDASGADRELDRRIAATLEGLAEGETAPDYTASVDSCLALIGRVLPGWHWHIGFGPRGIFPYATLEDGEARFEALAPTVPLALLQTVVSAKLADGGVRSGAGPVR